ncbi:MAG: TIGR04255 family protein [Ktedonobacteraceae bacterium]|nr:TIGR04255 family protein [Ktedonobacteraceae bacterium]
MGRRYESPPVIEALCEFKFDPDSFWDLTIPGLMYEKIQETFPRRNQVAQINAAITGNAEGIIQQFGAIPLMQFLREDGTSLVQVGQNLLTINQLKPYSSWQEFLPLIEKSLQAYKEVVHPKTVSHVALRYINRIEFEHNIELEDYLNFRPFLGKELPQEFSVFVVGVLLPRENTRDSINLQLTTINTDAPNTISLILDINYILTKPKEVELDNLLKWVDTAHKNVEEIFEACITDKLRQIFKEIQA